MSSSSASAPDRAAGDSRSAVDTAIKSLSLGQPGEKSPASDRRQQIFFHAAQLFLEKGFAATSMSDIARAVGITKAGIYHFVADKEELLFTLMSWGMAILNADVVEPAAKIEDPLDRLEFVVRAHLQNIARGSSVDRAGNPLTVILDEPAGLSEERRAAINREKRVYFEFVRKILIELNEREALADGDVSVATFSLLGMVVWFGRWFQPRPETDVRATIDQIVGMAMRSVVRSDVLAARA